MTRKQQKKVEDISRDIANVRAELNSLVRELQNNGGASKRAEAFALADVYEMLTRAQGELF